MDVIGSDTDPEMSIAHGEAISYTIVCVAEPAE